MLALNSVSANRRVSPPVIVRNPHPEIQDLGIMLQPKRDRFPTVEVGAVADNRLPDDIVPFHILAEGVIADSVRVLARRRAMGLE